MKKLVNFSLYLHTRFFIVLAAIVGVYILSFTYPRLFALAQVSTWVLFALLGIDIVLLYGRGKGIQAKRNFSDKFSNGDANDIHIEVENTYPFAIYLHIIDEIPIQFQYRNFLLHFSLLPNEKKSLQYALKPVERGEYLFGSLNVYAFSNIGFAIRRYRFSMDALAKVYPSFIQMRKYELLAISNRLTEAGIKKIRRLGHNMEFEQVKEYVRGDDVRTINWKATARKGNLMVNHYQDEKSQQVFSVIDKGRLMKMPFEGMSLLDYAINASLVISNIALRKSDKAGLITFHQEISTFLPASKSYAQMESILEGLYAQKTDFKEADFANLYIQVKKRISHRSLLLIYTNFESLSGLERQLPYLKRLATNHLIVVIFFENTEIKHLIETPARDTEEIYLQTIAEKFAYEKKMIVKELQRFGIQALLTSPQNLTVDSINKYLELKARGLI